MLRNQIRQIDEDPEHCFEVWTVVASYVMISTDQAYLLSP